VRAIASALGIATMLSACATPGRPDPIVRTGPSPAVEQPDGKLSADPAPLDLTDLANEPKGSASRTVLELLFWAEWGGTPFVTELYARDTVSTVGPKALAKDYELLRPELLRTRPEVAIACRQDGLTFVGVILRSKDNPPRRESFLLRRRAGGWRVVSDTLVERGLERAPVVARPTARDAAGAGSCRHSLSR
jgi:hypothetical protein